MLAILLAAGRDGVPYSIDMGRVSVATELALRAGFPNCVEKRTFNGDSRLRLKQAFLDNLSQACKDLQQQADKMADEASKLILLPPPRKIIPPPPPQPPAG